MQKTLTDADRSREKNEGGRGGEGGREGEGGRAAPTAGGCTMRERGKKKKKKRRRRRTKRRTRRRTRERRVSREGNGGEPGVYPVFEPKVQGCVQVNKLTRRRCERDFLSYQPQSAAHSLSSSLLPPPTGHCQGLPPSRARNSLFPLAAICSAGFASSPLPSSTSWPCLIFLLNLSAASPAARPFFFLSLSTCARARAALPG